MSSIESINKDLSEAASLLDSAANEIRDIDFNKKENLESDDLKKDKNFNVTLKTDFDPAIEKINIIPQDIGRVLLNLINNAFYAVNERSKEAVNGYVPAVTISTRLLTASENPLIRQSPPIGGRGAHSIIISVKDNGNGIPQKILDKIFQPFFTTKPTGQGTGLGLSLSYDIVKAHGGELRVETKEGEGSGFVIQLPVL